MLSREKLSGFFVSIALGVAPFTAGLSQAQPAQKHRTLIGCTPKQTICAIKTKTGIIGDKVTFHLPAQKRKKAPVAKGVIISVKGQKGDEQRALVKIEWGHGDIPNLAIPKPPTSPVSSWKSSFSQND